MTTITSAADSGKPNSSSGARINSATQQFWTTCPVCGQSYKYGEEHLCFDASLPTSTAEGYWTCSGCGQRVRYGELHVCGGRDDTGTWPPANPPNATWPPKPRSVDDWPYESNVTSPDPFLEERRVRALERIADALEKLIHEQKR